MKFLKPALILNFLLTLFFITNIAKANPPVPTKCPPFNLAQQVWPKLNFIYNYDSGLYMVGTAELGLDYDNNRWTIFVEQIQGGSLQEAFTTAQMNVKGITENVNTQPIEEKHRYFCQYYAVNTLVIAETPTPLVNR
jgi:hypothetical protein